MSAYTPEHHMLINCSNDAFGISQAAAVMANSCQATETWQQDMHNVTVVLLSSAMQEPGVK